MGWTNAPPISHTMDMQTARTATIVVGDVHGCGAELEQLIQTVERWFPAARLIFVGDLFTKGPEPGRVASAILDRRATGARVELVCGNHDLRLLSAVVRMQAGASRTDCEDCGAPIPEARQKAVPGVRRCVACQEADDADNKAASLFNRRGNKDSQLR